MVLVIHVLEMYYTKACKGGVTAFVSRRWKALGISSAGIIVSLAHHREQVRNSFFLVQVEFSL